MARSRVGYPTQYMGNNTPNPPNVTVAQRAPLTTDRKGYRIGDLWVDEDADIFYMFTSVSSGDAIWTTIGSGAAGAIITINSDAAVAGNMDVVGTTNEIDVSGVAGTQTLSLPEELIAPGSIEATTTITSGTTIESGTTITAGTSITATDGDITATDGNIVKGAAGNKDVYSSVATTATAGANSAGTVTLVGGTATITTTAVTADSLIRLTRQSVGATGAADLGILSVGTITAGTSFVINAWTVTDATALQADDVSVVFWEIVN